MEQQQQQQQQAPRSAEHYTTLTDPTFLVSSRSPRKNPPRERRADRRCDDLQVGLESILQPFFEQGAPEDEIRGIAQRAEAFYLSKCEHSFLTIAIDAHSRPLYRTPQSRRAGSRTASTAVGARPSAQTSSRSILIVRNNNSPVKLDHGGGRGGPTAVPTYVCRTRPPDRDRRTGPRHQRHPGPTRGRTADREYRRTETETVGESGFRFALFFRRRRQHHHRAGTSEPRSR